MNARGASVAGRLALAAFVLVASALVWPVAVYSQQGWSPESETVAIGDVSAYEDTTAWPDAATPVQVRRKARTSEITRKSA